MRRAIVMFTAVFLFMAGNVYADAYRMKNGRYADGSVTVITLNDEQLLTARTKRHVVLTVDQKRQLQADANVAPTILEIHSLRMAGKDCTCFDFNIAIWFADHQIEVPHRFLVRDAEAARRMDRNEAIWLGDESEVADVNSP